MDAATGAFCYVGLSHGLAGNRQGFPHHRRLYTPASLNG
jgi:hypothetical protein